MSELKVKVMLGSGKWVGERDIKLLKGGIDLLSKSGFYC